MLGLALFLHANGKLIVEKSDSTPSSVVPVGTALDMASGVTTAIAAPALSPRPGGVVAYAFAKASPLPVFDSPTLTGGRNEDFEFSTAYEVTERTSEYVRFKRPDGRSGYARLSHVALVSSPSWLAGSAAFNRAERARIRFWESSTKLNDYLSGINVAGSRWDYEEYFDTPPSFPLTLPIVGTDTLDLLSGDRQVRIVSVMLPISREMFEGFERAKANAETELDLHFLVDVSGSTKDFLETVLVGVAKAIARMDSLRNRVRSIAVTTFGATRTEKSSRVGNLSLVDIQRRIWHPQGVDQTTTGDREPLIDGLVTMSAAMEAERSRTPVLVVLSGADVELSGHDPNLGRVVPIENLDLRLPANTVAVFAQVTPEPGEDLRNASRRLRNLSTTRYVEFSESMADEVISELLRIADGRKDVTISLEAFAEVSKAAHEKRMMAFLPRVLNATSSLPSRQNYAAQSDWHTVRLWVTLDELIWKEITK